MPFEVIPAIDLRDGQVVRLTQGDLSAPEIYGHDPLALARVFRDAGASRVHIVDLNGAESGVQKHFDIAARIVRETGLAVQFGGGIRTEKTLARIMDAGIDRAVLGTIAARNPVFVGSMARKYPGRVAVGIDVRQGLIAVNGWEQALQRDPFGFAQDMEKRGVCAIIATSVSHDGMLGGIDRKMMLAFAAAVSETPIIAAGGIGNTRHIAEIADFAEDGIGGVILGKAYYQGLVPLRDALTYNTAPVPTARIPA